MRWAMWLLHGGPWALFVWWCVWCPVDAHANAAETEVNGLIVKAHRAFGAGRLEHAQALLRRADAALLRRGEKMRPRILANARLWSAYLWANTHRAMALLPPLDPIESFDTPKQLQQQIDRLGVPLFHLQAALGYLKKYNDLYRSTMRKGRFKDAVTLLGMTNRAQGLENRVQLVKLRIFRLKVALRLRRVEGKGRQVARLKENLKQQRKSLEKIRDKQLQFNRQLKQKGVLYSQAQALFLKRDQAIVRRRGVSQGLLVAGAITAAVGLVGVVIGASNLASNSGGYWLCQGISDGCVVGLEVMLGVGIALSAAGAAGMIAGLVMRPQQGALFRNVLQSHQRHLRPSATPLAPDASTHMGRWR